MFDFGIDAGRFLADHFEKNIYFRKGALAASPVQWSDVDRLLYGWDLDDSRLTLHRNGVVPPDLYVERRQDLDEIKRCIDRPRFYELLRQGATLVLNRVDAKSPVFGALCLALADFVGERVVANGYAAFGGDGTFGKHWDTHDVFAVQLIGKKHWTVYRPTFELPLPFQRSKNHKKECPAEPVFDAVLEAGDVLYIPRGWWHEAIPVEHGETFHIAAGIHTAKTVDYLGWLGAEILPQFVDARVTLRSDAPDPQVLERFLSTLCEAARAPDNLTRFAAGMQAMRNRAEDFDIGGTARAQHGAA